VYFYISQFSLVHFAISMAENWLIMIRIFGW